MNRQFPRPTLDGVLSLNSSQATNTNVSIVTSSSSRASTNNNHHLHHHAAPGGGGGGRDRAVAASYVVSDSGAQLTLGGAYHVSSTGAHELNPVTGSTTRLGRGDSSSRLNGGGLHGGGGGGGGAAGGSTSLSASNNREAGAGAGGGAGGPSSSSSLRCKHISELDMENGLLIGRGSSGRAYNVIHTPSGVRVCVKQMQIDDTRHREEVKRELDALHRAASRFVIDFYGAFFQNDLGVILLVLELMEGSMLDVMKSGVGGAPSSSSFSSSAAAAAGSGARLLRPLPERSIRAFALQVVLGLELLHQERGIIHRDIKPANLLFHRGGSVKIADFGVSTDCAALGEVDDPSSTHPPQTKTFVGSVLYMSPERLQGQPYSYSVDVWSLGVTLYEAAVGKHPFQEEGQPAPSFWELLQRVAQQDDALHSSPLRCHGGLGDRVSEAMDSFVALCLSYLPEDRPTASELLMHPWLQSLSLEESESIVAEVHTARQTLLEQQQQQQQQGIGSAAAASAAAGGAVQAEEGPQTLLCSAMLVGNGAPPSSTGGGGGEGSGGGGGAGAAAAGGGGGDRRQRGDALLSEFVASFQRTI